MKIAIPSSEGKLCEHFGHCESFTFVDVNMESKEILNIESRIPEEGISCDSAAWIAEQGADMVLAGGMGARQMLMFEHNGIQVITGCPELEIKSLVQELLNETLELGENSCVSDLKYCLEHHNAHYRHNH